MNWAPNRADLRQFLEGIQGRLVLGHGQLRQVVVVSHDDRAFRLARRPRPEQLGDFRLVVRRARPVAVTGRVDDGDVEAATGHQTVGAAGHRRVLLVVAAAVGHEDPRLFPAT
jgi:CHAD domain-containing protein